MEKHNNFCKGYISDDKFLEHMIPHHQMGIDMAQQVLKYSKNPAIISIARDIIWAQQNEIWVMRALLRSPSYNSQLSSNDINNYYNDTLLKYYYPSESEDLYTKGHCDMRFMKPCKNENIVNNYNLRYKYPRFNFWKDFQI